MLLIFLRHAKAEPHGHTSDEARALVDKGRKQVARVVARCKATGLSPEIVLSSPLRRAMETARGVTTGLGLEAPAIAPWLAIGRAANEALPELAAFRKFQTVMLVGHEPDFSCLVATLLGCSAQAVPVGKASMIGIECTAPLPGRGILQFAIPNKWL